MKAGEAQAAPEARARRGWAELVQVARQRRMARALPLGQERAPRSVWQAEPEVPASWRDRRQAASEFQQLLEMWRRLRGR